MKILDYKTKKSSDVSSSDAINVFPSGGTGGSPLSRVCPLHHSLVPPPTKISRKQYGKQQPTVKNPFIHWSTSKGIGLGVVKKSTDNDFLLFIAFRQNFLRILQSAWLIALTKGCTDNKARSEVLSKSNKNIRKP